MTVKEMRPAGADFRQLDGWAFPPHVMG
jgi:hypothetical protein